MNPFIDDFFFLGQIVLQPTTLCNLNCSYCYLPERNRGFRMNSEVTSRLAEGIRSMDLEYCVPLIWHGGEPLAYGVTQFVELIEPLEALRLDGKINHCVQTNGTLIDEAWCQFFKQYKIEVGVSIDGPETLNANRVDWNGKASFDKIMRGINLLKKHSINFTCIAVVPASNLPKAKQLYEFFCEVGCESVGINIEEKLGINSTLVDSSEVSLFWSELFLAWRDNPRVKVREFTNIIQWMGSILGESTPTPNRTDIFPTIGWNGDVVLLSPEMLGVKSITYDFTAGNMLMDDLQTILIRGQRSRYVEEYRLGVEMCRSECKFFDHCRGGQASNKFFETGKIATTETLHCKNAQQTPVEAVMKLL